MRQQVLVLEAWTAHTIRGTTPHFEGATLGGFYRLRGYEGSRFHDQSAICYSLEYRMIPDWNPFRKFEALEVFKIDWWQCVLFAEAGRVAPEWNMELLHEEMKYDAGISLRAMILKSVGRIDIAASEEGLRIAAMYGHPF